MLIILTGNVGSGKTALACLSAKYSNRIKLSNAWLNDSKYQQLEPEKLMELDPTLEYLVLIDECYVWLESFTSGSKLERYLSYILFQSRKLNIDIILTSQLIRRVNINFKEMEDVRIECYKDIERKCFIYTFKYYDNNEYYENSCEIDITDMGKLLNKWTYYKTMERINPPEMKDLSYEFIYKDREKMNKLIDKVIIEMKITEINKISKAFVSDRLLKLGYPQKLVIPILNRLKADVET